jgi:ElaB/YqjD/DUF883 family membrane-anchored ribosome-binding protein
MEEMMDINKLITESLSALINEDNSEFDAAKEAVTNAGRKVLEKGKAAADATKEAATNAGGKVTGIAKTAVKEGKDFINENPKTSAAMAAALAAGLGAVAFRKKLAALAKKGMPVVKKKTAANATKIAKKLES